eukprot:GFUD01004008.1.p1 GENE.GFUD01004008.1~~GFUD01004008.1.p1  ORF type:complete len:510 (+),score=121.56 GFUD01004008.1:56-1585(+)
MTDMNMSEGSSNLFETFPELDLLGDYFSSQFDLHGDDSFIVSELSTESSRSDAMEIDLQEELDNLLKAEGFEPIFDMKTQDEAVGSQNSNDQDRSKDTVDMNLFIKEEEDSVAHFPSNHHSESMTMNGISVQFNEKLRKTSQVPLKEEDYEELLSVKEEQLELNIPQSTMSYIRHIQPMPERTSPLPKTSKRTWNQANQQIHPSFPASDRAHGKEVTYLGRTIIPLKQLKNKRKYGPGSKPHLQSCVSTIEEGQNMMIEKPRSVLRSNLPQLKAHSLNPVLGSVNFVLSPEIHINSQFVDIFEFPGSASSNVIFTRKSSKEASKFRRGVSILKPVSAANQSLVGGATERKLIRRAEHVVERHSFKTAQDTEQLSKGMFGEITQRSIMIGSPCGWVSKNDPFKEKKNQLERDRRGELAMSREKLRVMLPQTKELEKVATVTVLESARDYCSFLQREVDKLETELMKQERQNVALKRSLFSLQPGQIHWSNAEIRSNEKITIENYFRCFEV